MGDAYKKFDLTGRSALVTGGATGIGYNIAKALGESGAKVMIAARREEVLKDAREKLAAECPQGEFVHATVDLSQPESVKELSQRAGRDLGGVDIFVGNAGQDCLDKIIDIKDETIDYMLQMNVASNIRLTRDFMPHMREQKWGRILYSSSVTSVVPSATDGVAVYTAAKGALNSFTRTAAVESGHYGITVNSLLIGFFHTDIIDQAIAWLDANEGPGAGAAFVSNLSSMTALGRPCALEEIEGLVQLLASNAGSAITGTNSVIDGGLTVMLRPLAPPVA